MHSVIITGRKTGELFHGLASIRLRFLIMLLLLMLFSISEAATCRVKSKTCVDNAPTKTVSGVQVPISMTQDGCWDWQYVYECDTQAGVNYCEAISSTPGCTHTSTVCLRNDPVAGCIVKQKTFRCSNKVTPLPTGVIQLNDTHTITYENVDRAPCGSLANNPSCTYAGQRCIDGPGTKNINGANIYRDCWQWREDYSCVVQNPVDYCTPLARAGCWKARSDCIQTGTTGTCIKYMHTYRCDNKQQPPPANTTYLDTVYTIIEDREDHSQCAQEENNLNCTLAEKVCIEGPETRNINGLDVYKPCWKWKTDYVCASTELKSTCDELKANPLCTEVASKCVDTLPAGQCGLLEHQYKCAEPAPGTTTETDCGLQTFCVDGTCFDTGYPPDQDIFKVLTAMEAANEASMMDLFKGEASSCSKNAINSCCKAQPGGESATNRAVASTAIMTGLKIGVEYINLYGSSYVYDALNTSSVAYLQLLGAKMDAHMMTQPNFSVWGAKFTVGVDGISYAGFDPWSLGISVAMLVVSELMSCEQDEQLLGMKRGQGLCAHVGSWCSRKILNACAEKKEGWCCFSSVLARIVNEQGRAQIGKPWGDPQNPNCNGFSLAELERLRFDEMDLTEFFNSINIPGKDGHYAAERLQEKSANYYAP